MRKKIKMKDIAEKANVSTATVSYILNNVKNQCISNETICRVKKIAKELDYTPNFTARSLACRKSGLIGILIVRDFSKTVLWKDYIYIKFINKIRSLLEENGYHILVSIIDVSNPKFDIIFQRELDGVFLLDVNEEMFYRISSIFDVPIILIDGYLDDTIFHKIILDFETAISKAQKLLGYRHSFLITDRFNNNRILNKIKVTSGVPENDFIIVDTEEELSNFIVRHKDQKGIVVNEYIGLIASRYINAKDIAVVCTCDCPFILPHETKKVIFDEKRMSIAVDLMMSYVKGNFLDEKSKYTIIKVC